MNHPTADTELQSPRAVRTRLRAVLVCDLVDSTRLYRQLGDARAAELLRNHDRLSRRLLATHGGREVDKSDGFLVLFDRPVAAVAFALDYLKALKDLHDGGGSPLQARVGIHFGEVLIWRNEPDEVAAGAATITVEGLAKPIAARLAALATAGQVLVSEVARSLSEGHSGLADAEPWQWAALGAYRVKGVYDPIHVHEVASSRAGLRGAPAATGTARGTRSASRRVALVLAPVLLVVAVAITLSAMLLRAPDAIAFGERDWVVIASLENHTADPRYNGALESALRSSLEQSRHVNVVPEQRMREVLSRMAREPDTRIDRGIGSEIALRSGARAVIVPTIATNGGGLAVGVEVVDPVTGSAVFTESADGAGAQGPVGALGEVGARLRGRLGETLEQVQAASVPLVDATSPSLDALRAYSLGVRADGEGRSQDALLHYEQALALDPDFAGARASVGRVLLSLGERETALAAIKAALARPDRLSERDFLSLNALAALVERRPDYVDRLRALLALYPDHHPAAHNLALASWYNNRFEEMLEHAQRAAAPQSITRPSSVYTQGMALVGLGRFDAAREAFDRAVSLGYSREVSVLSAAGYAAERRFDEARAVLRSEPASSPSVELTRRSLELSMAADEGRWAELPELAERLVEASTDATGSGRWSGLAAQLAVMRGPDEEQSRRLRSSELIALATRRLETADAVDFDAIAMALLYAGFVSVRDGDLESARVAVGTTQALLVDSPLPLLEQMAVVVLARIDIAEGRQGEAIARLEPLLDGSELVLVRALLGEAYLAEGRADDALNQMQWLANHRGRAYAELAAGYLLRSENLVQSNRALLRTADIYLQQGDPEQARRWLERFDAAWPTLDAVPDLKQYRDRISAGINAA